MIKDSCVALGFFDGVHIAHQKLIEKTISISKKEGLCPLVLTFDYSPMSLLSQKKVSYLTLPEEKEKIISGLGAKTHFLPLTKELLTLNAEDFVRDILVKEYHIKHAVCGYNYTFGYGGKGEASLLLKLGEKYGFKAEIIPGIKASGDVVSSSRIRNLIREGKVKEASLLLGRNYCLSGTVQRGKQLGKKLGFPTANMFFDEKLVFPKAGVYKTVAIIDAKRFNAITNAGINPTVGGEDFRAETHIPRFEENLYGKEITIEFLDFIRDEKKFENLTLLTQQIQKDLLI